MDASVSEDIVGQKITIAIPRAFETEQSLDQSVSEKDGVTDDQLAQQRAQQIKEFKVSAVEKDKSVPAKKSVLTLTDMDGTIASEIGKIKIGAIWILQNSDESLKIQEVLYRVMNVSEQNAMEYDLLCLEYNDSKFDSVENDLTLDKVRYKGISTPTDEPNIVNDAQVAQAGNAGGADSSDKTIIVKLGSDTASSLANGDIINVALVLESSVNGDGKRFTKTFSQAAFDKNGQKVTTISIVLKDFQGHVVSEKITIEKDTGSSNTGLPMP